MTVSYIFSIIGYVIGLVAIGLVASFSVLLYITQVAVLSNNSRAVQKSLTLMSGVAAGVLLLLGIFVLIQLETYYVPSASVMIGTYRTTWTDASIGVICILVAVYLFSRKKRESTQLPRSSQQEKLLLARGGLAALFSFSFLRTITRVSGVAACIVAARIIMSSDHGVMRIISMAILIAAALVPYGALLIIKLVRPDYFDRITIVRKKMLQFPTQKVAALSIGALGIFLLFVSLLSIHH